MKRNPDATRNRLAVTEGRFERPLSRGDDRRFVQIAPARLDYVGLRNVPVDVDGDGQNDVGVFSFGECRRRVHGVDVLNDDWRLHVGGRLRKCAEGKSRNAGCAKQGAKGEAAGHEVRAESMTMCVRLQSRREVPDRRGEPKRADRSSGRANAPPPERRYNARRTSRSSSPASVTPVLIATTFPPREMTTRVGSASTAYARAAAPPRSCTIG